MKLYLVRHGQSLSEDIDPEQGLSDEGKSESEKVAQYSAKAGVKPSYIYHSLKKRARQTAEYFQKACAPDLELKEIEGLKPMDDVTIWADKIETEFPNADEDIMLVGHLPHMARLSGLLLAKDENKVLIDFKASALACLEKNDDGSWSILFIVNPEIV